MSGETISHPLEKKNLSRDMLKKDFISWLFVEFLKRGLPKLICCQEHRISRDIKLASSQVSNEALEKRPQFVVAFPLVQLYSAFRFCCGIIGCLFQLPYANTSESPAASYNEAKEI